MLLAIILLGLFSAAVAVVPLLWVSAVDLREALAQAATAHSEMLAAEQRVPERAAA